MINYSKNIDYYREKFFTLFLVIMVVALPFSEAIISIATGLLLGQALILRSWNHWSVSKKRVSLAVFPISIFIIYVIGAFFTEDIKLAFRELKKVIFWVVIPLAVALSPKLSKKELFKILFLFIAAVTISSFIYSSKLLMNDKIFNYRQLCFVSHIRFSFQVILAVAILSWFIIKRDNFSKKIRFIFCAVWVWLVVFLILLKSLIGIGSFILTVFIVAIYFIINSNNTKYRSIFGGLIFVFVFCPLFYISKVIYDFYDYKPVRTECLEDKTVSGNNYYHNLNNKARENGYLVNIYICREEIREEWNKVSDIKYDDIVKEYPVGDALIRYLTSKGYRKDSIGVSMLNDYDISLIQQGVTNFKFGQNNLSVYQRIYETIWELDTYFRTGDPNNKTLAQRMEFAKAAIFIIKHNFWVGIGTGNWETEFFKAYDAMNSKLTNDNRGSSHNQYLNYFVKFGVIGFFLIIFFVFIPYFVLGHIHNFIFTTLLVFISVANIGDSNLETHMGLSFFVLFYSIFLWNSPPEMKQKIL